MDYLTQWPEAYSLRNQEASTVAEDLLTKFCCRFGIPWELHSDQGRNFESRLLHEIHINKLSMLKSYRDLVGSGPASGSKKFVFNLSEYVPTDNEKSVLRKDLNFTIVNPLLLRHSMCTWIGDPKAPTDFWNGILMERQFAEIQVTNLHRKQEKI
jgi:hypothetical protein